MTEREHIFRMIDGSTVRVPIERDTGRRKALSSADPSTWINGDQFADREATLARLTEDRPAGGAVLPPLPQAFARLLNEERAGR